MSVLKTVLDSAAVVVGVAAAIAAFLSAREAKRAATETRNGIQAQLLSTLLDQHSADDSLTAFILLREWASSRKDAFAREFQALRRDRYAEVAKVDQARRRLSLYLYKVHQLVLADLIDDSVRRAVMPRTTAEFCCEFIEPLEAAIRDNYEPAAFTWLAEKYNVARYERLFPLASAV